MLKYICKRLLWLIPVIVCATLIVFLLMSMAQGDPARTLLGAEVSQETVDALREDMGLNDPILVQYGRYMLGVCRGDLGTSYKSGGACSEEILARFPNTVKLAVAALLLTIVFTNVFLTRSLFRHISEPLELLVAGVERVEHGDLDTPIAYTGADDYIENRFPPAYWSRGSKRICRSTAGSNRSRPSP